MLVLREVLAVNVDAARNGRRSSRLACPVSGLVEHLSLPKIEGGPLKSWRKSGAHQKMVQRPQSTMSSGTARKINLTSCRTAVTKNGMYARALYNIKRNDGGDSRSTYRVHQTIVISRSLPHVLAVVINSKTLYRTSPVKISCRSGRGPGVM